MLGLGHKPRVQAGRQGAARFGRGRGLGAFDHEQVGPEGGRAVYGWLPGGEGLVLARAVLVAVRGEGGHGFGQQLDAQGGQVAAP